DMFNFLPVPVTAIHAGPLLRPVAVDPAVLSQVAGQLLKQAAALRAGATTLLRAWDQAAWALAGQHTGAVLAATRPSSGVALDQFAGLLESLSDSLRQGAARYALADGSAVPGSSPAGTAWIP